MSIVKRSLIFFILAFIEYNLISVNPLSIGATSDNVTDANHVNKREANPQLSGDVFPDWVPFKNKHGEELGEFVQVPKAKPKKRLALPMNFKLRAVAEPQNDYLDKVQEDSESEADYFENKEWNEATGALQENKEIKTNPEVVLKTEDTSNTSADNRKEQKHREISDIDGVVSIIKSVDPNSVALEKNILTTVSPEHYKKYDNVNSKEGPGSSKEVILKDNNEEDNDYDETKTSKEDKESDAKKAFILNSVDELKERHALEQKYISEKAKEEERIKEKLERDTIRAKNKRKSKKAKDFEEENYHDDYEDDVKIMGEKYKIKPRLTTTTPTTTTIQKRSSSTTFPHKPRKESETSKLSLFRNPRLYMVYNEDETESPHRKKTTRRQRVTTTTTVAPSKAPKFSSRYVSTPSSPLKENESDNNKDDTEEVERGAFVPEKESDSGEPTRFFPKRRKVKKTKTTTKAATEFGKQPEVTVADATASGSANSVSNTIPINFFTNPNADGTTGTGTGSSSELTSPSAFSSSDLTSSAISTPEATSVTSKITTSDTTAPSGEDVHSTGAETAPSGPTGQMSNSIEVIDGTPTTEQIRATTHEKENITKNSIKQALLSRLAADLDASSTNKHKKEDLKEDGGDHEHESGGAKDYHSEHEEEHGEHGKKAYELHSGDVYNETKKILHNYIQNIREDNKHTKKNGWTSKNRFKDEVLYQPKPWGITKIRNTAKGITIKRTTMETTTTTEATISTSTTRATTMAPIITRNMAKSTPSTRSPASTAKDTAPRAHTTSTKRTSTRKKLSSSRKRAIRERRKNMAGTTRRKSTRRAGNSKKATSMRTITRTTKGKQDTSAKADLVTDTRATSIQEDMTATGSAHRRTSRKRGTMAARNGSTTTGLRRRRRTSLSLIDGRTACSSGHNTMGLNILER